MAFYDNFAADLSFIWVSKMDAFTKRQKSNFLTKPSVLAHDDSPMVMLSDNKFKGMLFESSKNTLPVKVSILFTVQLSIRATQREKLKKKKDIALFGYLDEKRAIRYQFFFFFCQEWVFGRKPKEFLPKQNVKLNLLQKILSQCGYMPSFVGGHPVTMTWWHNFDCRLSKSAGWAQLIWAFSVRHLTAHFVCVNPGQKYMCMKNNGWKNFESRQTSIENSRAWLACKEWNFTFWSSLIFCRYFVLASSAENRKKTSSFARSMHFSAKFLLFNVFIWKKLRYTRCGDTDCLVGHIFWLSTSGTEHRAPGWRRCCRKCRHDWTPAVSPCSLGRIKVDSFLLEDSKLTM